MTVSAPRGRWVLALACAVLCGCDIVLCNPEFACEGTVVVRCDVKCSGGGGKLDPPKACQRVETRRDCADETATLGVPRTCRVLENVAVCVDDPVTPCEDSHVSSCTSTGARTGCVTIYTPENKLIRTSTCAGGQTCHPIPTGAGCVDSPKVSCDPDAGFPRCTSATTWLSCVGTEDAGFVTASIESGLLCRDGGP